MMTAKTRKILTLLVLLLLIVVCLIGFAGAVFTTVYVSNAYQAEATAIASAGVVRATASKQKKPALHTTPTVSTAPIRQLPLSARQEQALKTFFSIHVFLEILGAALLLLGGALLVLHGPALNTTAAHGSSHFLTITDGKPAAFLVSPHRRVLPGLMKTAALPITP